MKTMSKKRKKIKRWRWRRLLQRCLTLLLTPTRSSGDPVLSSITEVLALSPPSLLQHLHPGNSSNNSNNSNNNSSISSRFSSSSSCCSSSRRCNSSNSSSNCRNCNSQLLQLPLLPQL